MIYTTFNNTKFTLQIVENIKIFNEIGKLNLVEPKPPKYLIRNGSSGPVYGENIMHPKYAEAMNLYNTRLAIEGSKIGLLLCIKRNKDILEGLRSNPANKLSPKTDEQLWLTYINQNTNNNDKIAIINQCFLTENAVYTIFNILAQGVYRNHNKITEARLINGLNNTIQINSLNFGDIQLVHPVDEFNCAVGSGFSLAEWRESSIEDRAETLALFRLSRIIENHAQDEAQEQSKKKSKK